MKISSLCLLAAIAVSFVGCKTTDSAVKSETEGGEMSKEEFVEACNQRLSDPKDGPAIGMSLQSFAQAKDCNDAYEKIKAILAKTKG